MNLPAQERPSWRGRLLLSLGALASVVVVVVAAWGLAEIIYLIINAK